MGKNTEQHESSLGSAIEDDDLATERDLESEVDDLESAAHGKRGSSESHEPEDAEKGQGFFTKAAKVLFGSIVAFTFGLFSKKAREYGMSMLKDGLGIAIDHDEGSQQSAEQGHTHARDEELESSRSGVTSQEQQVSSTRSASHELSEYEQSQTSRATTGQQPYLAFDDYVREAIENLAKANTQNWDNKAKSVIARDAAHSIISQPAEEITEPAQLKDMKVPARLNMQLKQDENGKSFYDISPEHVAPGGTLVLPRLDQNNQAVMLNGQPVYDVLHFDDKGKIDPTRSFTHDGMEGFGKSTLSPAMQEAFDQSKGLEQGRGQNAQVKREDEMLPPHSTVTIPASDYQSFIERQGQVTSSVPTPPPPPPPPPPSSSVVHEPKDNVPSPKEIRGQAEPELQQGQVGFVQQRVKMFDALRRNQNATSVDSVTAPRPSPATHLSNKSSGYGR